MFGLIFVRSLHISGDFILGDQLRTFPKGRALVNAIGSKSSFVSCPHEGAILILLPIPFVKPDLVHLATVKVSGGHRHRSRNAYVAMKLCLSHMIRIICVSVLSSTTYN